MRYTPKPQNKKATVMTIALLILGLACFAVASYGFVKYHGALQIIGLFIVAFSVYFMIKSLTSYSYMVLPKNADEKAYKEGVPVGGYKPAELAFTVSKMHSASRETLVCQLDMASLIAVKDIPDSTKKNDVISSFKPCDVYDYSVTVGPKSETLLVFKKRGYNKTAVICELSDEMLGYFKQVKKINDENRKNEDDE